MAENVAGTAVVMGQLILAVVTSGMVLRSAILIVAVVLQAAVGALVAVVVLGHGGMVVGRSRTHHFPAEGRRQETGQHHGQKGAGDG